MVECFTPLQISSVKYTLLKGLVLQVSVDISVLNILRSLLRAFFCLAMIIKLFPCTLDWDERARLWFDS